MTTDEEKSRLSKLLDNLEVPEVKLSERCHDLVTDFHRRFAKEVEEESLQMHRDELEYTNPYKVDRALLDENERKLKDLIKESTRKIKELKQEKASLSSSSDPNRPWRTNSCKEKLLHIDHELKRHHQKATELISPVSHQDMKELVEACRAEGGPATEEDRLKNAIDEAKKDLTNFQYRNIKNSTATAILPIAHTSDDRPLQVAKVTVD